MPRDKIAGWVGQLAAAAATYELTGSYATAAIAATIGASAGYYAAAYVTGVRWSYRADIPVRMGGQDREDHALVGVASAPSANASSDPSTRISMTYDKRPPHWRIGLQQRYQHLPVAANYLIASIRQSYDSRVRRSNQGGAMAAKTDFTAEEWDTMQKGVTGAGMLVAVADPGFFDTFKEIGALTKHLTEAQSKSTNPLISELAKVRGTGFGLTSSPQEVETETTQALKSSMGTLKAKAPDDAQAYRDFVLDVAKSVGAAAKDTSASESAAIQKIDAALATP